MYRGLSGDAKLIYGKLIYGKLMFNIYGQLLEAEPIYGKLLDGMSHFFVTRAVLFCFSKAGHEPPGVLSLKSRGGDVYRGASAEGSTSQSTEQASTGSV